MISAFALILQIALWWALIAKVGISAWWLVLCVPVGVGILMNTNMMDSAWAGRVHNRAGQKTEH